MRCSWDTFLRETEGLEFMEAAERLAEMAGLTVPEVLLKILRYHVNANHSGHFRSNNIVF